jgi:hypothetical protein
LISCAATSWFGSFIKNPKAHDHEVAAQLSKRTK